MCEPNIICSSMLVKSLTNTQNESMKHGVVNYVCLSIMSNHTDSLRGSYELYLELRCADKVVMVMELHQCWWTRSPLKHGVVNYVSRCDQRASNHTDSSQGCYELYLELRCANKVVMVMALHQCWWTRSQLPRIEVYVQNKAYNSVWGRPLWMHSRLISKLSPW